MMERIQGLIPQRMIQRSRYPAHAPSHCHNTLKHFDLTNLQFDSQKAEVFPPWTSRLERVLQSRTLRQIQMQTVKGEPRAGGPQISIICSVPTI